MRARKVFETYESIDEISQLAQDIRLKLIEYIQKHSINLDEYFHKLSNSDEFDIEDLIKVSLKDLDPSNYKTIYNFVNGFDLIVGLGTGNSRYYGSNTIEEADDDYGQVIIWSPIRDAIFGTKTWYQKLETPLLIHELVHAYDDFTSKGKFDNSKKNIKYYNNNFSEKIGEIDRQIKGWSRLPTEISAILSEIITGAQYFDPGTHGRKSVGWNNIFRDNNGEMISLHDLNNRFKYWIEKNKDHHISWTPKIEKSIIRKLSQYWHKEKEKEMEKEKYKV